MVGKVGEPRARECVAGDARCRRSRRYRRVPAAARHDRRTVHGEHPALIGATGSAHENDLECIRLLLGVRDVRAGMLEAAIKMEAAAQLSVVRRDEPPEAGSTTCGSRTGRAGHALVGQNSCPVAHRRWPDRTGNGCRGAGQGTAKPHPREQHRIIRCREERERDPRLCGNRLTDRQCGVYHDMPLIRRRPSSGCLASGGSEGTVAKKEHSGRAVTPASRSCDRPVSHRCTAGAQRRKRGRAPRGRHHHRASRPL